MADDPCVRAPVPADAEALAHLLAAMEAHYGNISPPGAADLAARRLAIDDANAGCLVAAQGEALLGVALFGVVFPGVGLTEIVYLKDLYVAAGARGRGVGRALMRRLAAFALARGASRLEWSTGVDNTAARAFYAGLGAAQREKLVYQADRGVLARMATAEQG